MMVFTSNERSVVAVLGATGVQGGAVLRHLSKSGNYHVRAVTRDPSSARAVQLAKMDNVLVVKGDMLQPESLLSAFTGAEAVFAVTNFYDVKDDSIAEARMGCATADIVQKAGIKIFVWSSVPSALVRTGAKYASNALVENKQVVNHYLKYKNIPHAVVYVGWYYDNFVNTGCLTKSDDKTLVLDQPLLEADAPQGFSWVEKDLGPTVEAVLKQYRTNPKVMQQPIYSVARHDTLRSIINEIERQTGFKVELKTSKTTGIKDLDELYGYENEYGIMTDVTLPEPFTASLGVKFHSLENFVREAVVPYVQSL